MSEVQVRTDNFCITIIEAGFIFGKTRKTIEFAIWQDKIKARQAYGSRQWILDYESCVKHFGYPLNNQLVEQIRMDWNE